MDSTRVPNFGRELLNIRFTTYSRIVSRKHSIAAPFSVDDVKSWSDEELSAYVEVLRDLAHLPPD